MRISQMLVPCAPCTLLSPKIAISELVSKPRPNKIPRGNIFHGRSTTLNTLRNTFARNPSPSNFRLVAASSSSSSTTSPVSALLLSCSSTTLSLRMSLYKTQPLPAQSSNRNAALTLVPMMLPTRVNPSNRSLSAPLVAATTTHVTITMVLWPSEKKVPTVTGRWPEAIRRRVMRSMAEMWSASRAWRRPSR